MNHKILVQRFSDENICARDIIQEWDDAFSLIYVPLSFAINYRCCNNYYEILKCFCILFINANISC